LLVGIKEAKEASLKKVEARVLPSALVQNDSAVELLPLLTDAPLILILLHLLEAILDDLGAVKLGPEDLKAPNSRRELFGLTSSLSSVCKYWHSCLTESVEANE